MVGERGGDEGLPRHACHRGEHALVPNPARAELTVDHVGTALFESPVPRHAARSNA
jgi:hypothetical protein